MIQIRNNTQIFVGHRGLVKKSMNHKTLGSHKVGLTNYFSKEKCATHVMQQAMEKAFLKLFLLSNAFLMM